MQPKPAIHPASNCQNKSVCYIPALTGLRAIGAYLVFLHHYNPAAPGTFTNRLFAQGYVGVSVFFVLSGFLIYHRYADEYFGQRSWSWRTYLQNRFARIFPLYALMLLVTVGANYILGRAMSWPLLGVNLTLLKGFFDTYKFSGIAQSWSLTVEICFYLSVPLLFMLLKRWGALPLTAALVMIGLGLWATVGQAVWHGLFSSLPFLLFYTFFGRAFEFIVGLWLARRWHQNRLPSVRYATVSGLLLIAACIFWQANLSTITANPISLLWSEVVTYNYGLPIGIGVLFLGLLKQKSIIRQLLSQPIMQTLGRSSYAFYLIHVGVIANGLQKVGITNHWLLFGLLIVIAHGLHHFVEKPLHEWLQIQ